MWVWAIIFSKLVMSDMHLTWIVSSSSLATSESISILSELVSEEDDDNDEDDKDDDEDDDNKDEDELKLEDSDSDILSLLMSSSSSPLKKTKVGIIFGIISKQHSLNQCLAIRNSGHDGIIK
jgi:hypothetical protein